MQGNTFLAIMTIVKKTQKLILLINGVLMKKGFTLVELLAVVLIMAILTAIALPQYRRSVERARVAEALQMLPAIFDARERLMTERGWNFSSSSLPPISFSKLDIDMKGKKDGDTKMLTENFSYSLADSCAGVVCSTTDLWVSATFLKGTYKGTRLFYKGGNITCCPGTVQDACSRLNLPSATCSISHG